MEIDKNIKIQAALWFKDLNDSFWWWTYLKVLLNTLRCDRLGDDDDIPLNVEADEDLYIDVKLTLYQIINNKLWRN